MTETISLPYHELSESLSALSGILPRNPFSEILGTIKIYAQDGACCLECNSGDVAILTKLTDQDYSFSWSAAVMGSSFIDIVKRLKGTTVDITLAEEGSSSHLKIKNGSFKSNISCLDVSEFPSISLDMDSACTFDISCKDFTSLVDRTKFSVYPNENRYNISGFFLEVDSENKRISMVTTDGHRLSVVRCANENASEFNSCLIPKKTIIEVAKILSKKADNVKISFSRNKIHFELSNIVLTSKLIDAEFPDYNKVIPASNDLILSIDKSDFIGAIDRVSSIYSGTKDSVVDINITPSSLELSCQSSLNQANDSVPCSFNGEGLIMKYNYRYLLDVMSVLSKNDIEISLKDPLTPLVISSEESIFIVMPVRK